MSLTPIRFLASALLVSFAQAGFSDAADASRPNILFIIFDDWGWQHSGAYGCSWVKTPNVDRLAREGVLFRNAFTSNPKCSPCRASMLTGRNTWQLEEAVCHSGIFPPKFAVYPDILEAAGYEVGLTGKGWGPGEFRLNGRTRNPAGPAFDRFNVKPPATGIASTDYAKNFEAFLEKRSPDKPFCFWMGFKEPHRGYEAGSGAKAGKKPEDVTVPAYLPDIEIIRTDLADYAVEVEYADSHIGRTLAALEKHGVLENTLIVVTSDHGMPFPFVKGQIHEDGFHLPLVMRWGKGIKAGRVVDDFINVRDLAPTYLELAGLKVHEQMTGKSLAAILKSEASGWIENRDVMLVGKERHDLGRPHDWGYPVRGIRTKDYLYVHNYFPDRWPVGNPETGFGNCDDSPSKSAIIALGGYYYELCFGKRQPDELYRIADDNDCVRSLAGDIAFKSTMDGLQSKMIQLLIEDSDPRALGNGTIFDTYKNVGSNRKKSYDHFLKNQKLVAPTASQP